MEKADMAAFGALPVRLPPGSDLKQALRVEASPR
jgi:hypothetical protein